MERSFYKLTITALVVVVIAQFITMSGSAVSYLEMSRYSSGVTFFESLIFFAYLGARFLLYVCALYWLPKIIKKFFPEVA
ncbi:MAG: hypothetical protein JKY31_03680 [Rhodobacteraceae bacterium]|nr:hypothetical protein [Paracoccaceae bacterium]